MPGTRNRRSTMELLQGTVRHVRHATEVHGGRQRVNTYHVAVFDIGRVQVTFRSADPIPIGRGDEVRVLGHAYAGETFGAVAYHNLTRDVVEDSLPRGGCVGLVLMLGFLGAIFGMMFLVQAFVDPSLFRWAWETVPRPVLLVPPALLAAAIVLDRRRAARVEEMLAPLYDDP